MHADLHRETPLCSHRILTDFSSACIPPPPYPISPSAPKLRVYQGICPAPPLSAAATRPPPIRSMRPQMCTYVSAQDWRRRPAIRPAVRRNGLAHVTALPPAAVLHLSRLKQKIPTLLTLYASRPAGHQATASAACASASVFRQPIGGSVGLGGKFSWPTFPGREKWAPVDSRTRKTTLCTFPA